MWNGMGHKQTFNRNRKLSKISVKYDMGEWSAMGNG